MVGIINGLRQAYETTRLAVQLEEMKKQLEDLTAKTGS